jgi:hypothetical protein
VLLDDIADRGGDPELLEQLLAVPFDESRLTLKHVRPEDRAYAEFTIDLWQEIKRRTKTLPLYGQYARLWRYDYLQLSGLSGRLAKRRLAKRNAGGYKKSRDGATRFYH